MLTVNNNNNNNRPILINYLLLLIFLKVRTELKRIVVEKSIENKPTQQKLQLLVRSAEQLTS